jgi:hypothetical protein
MGAGVDPDCELFASGIVKDDEDDWGVGAHPLAAKQAVPEKKVGEAYTIEVYVLCITGCHCTV